MRRCKRTGICAYVYIMEVTFTALKQKDVINLTDGKNMGKVCDMTFSFPENFVKGFTVTGCKGFRFSKQEVFIPVKNVVKIGKDAVLVKLGDKEPAPPPPDGKPCPPAPPKPNCPPYPCPPPCPPCPPNGYPLCPPERPPSGRPPKSAPPPDRRSYDEYE